MDKYTVTQRRVTAKTPLLYVSNSVAKLRDFTLVQNTRKIYVGIIRKTDVSFVNNTYNYQYRTKSEQSVE